MNYPLKAQNERFERIYIAIRTARKEILMPNDQIMPPKCKISKKMPTKSKRGPILVSASAVVQNQCRLASNNLLFKKLLYLTGIRKDEATIKILFSEQGIEITSELIKAWTSTSPSNSFKAMPDEALIKFFDALFSVRNECRLQEINIFDLNGIFDDIRPQDVKVA